MSWISIVDELPIQSFGISVKNGKNILHNAIYYRKKWYAYDRKLHKVTHWYKCPVSYLKIPHKDLIDFLKRAKKYKNQMNSKEFTFYGQHLLFGPLV